MPPPFWGPPFGPPKGCDDTRPPTVGPPEENVSPAKGRFKPAPCVRRGVQIPGLKSPTNEVFEPRAFKPAGIRAPMAPGPTLAPWENPLEAPGIFAQGPFLGTEVWTGSFWGSLETCASQPVHLRVPLFPPCCAKEFRAISSQPLGLASWKPWETASVKWGGPNLGQSGQSGQRPRGHGTNPRPNKSVPGTWKPGP